VIQRHIVADLGGLPDDHTHAVIDKKTPSYRRARMNLDAGQAPRDMRQKTRHPLQVCMPQGVRHAVEDTRVYARIAGQHLESAARRRVAFEHAGDIFSNVFEHAFALLGNAI
jgi:hypothetical protein